MSKKRCLTFLIAILSLNLSIQAQDNKEIAGQLIQVADEIYTSTSAYNQARDAYVQVLDFDPENLKANYMAGFLYLQTVQKERSTQYLLKVYELDPEYSFDLMYLIGRGYQFGLDFENALKFYNLYIDYYNREPDYAGADKISVETVRLHISECEVGRKLIQSPLNYNITNVGPNINSEYPDYGPSVNRDENIMVFTTRRQEGNTNADVYEDNFPYEDIFISYKQGDDWTKATNISPSINTRYFESSLVISNDGKYLYLYLDENSGDIYVSRKIDDVNWAPPEPLPGEINSSYKETSISISDDNKLIFFASDRPGTIGGLDIFYSLKDRRGVWSVIKNLGPAINSDKDDDFPFLASDGKTLYFSSEGHEGMGGFDVYKTVYDSANETWINPVNVGYPINTPDDDISFITVHGGKKGYFSSVREDGYGYQDIYAFTVPEEIQNISEKQVEVVKEPDPVIVKEPEIIPEKEVEKKPTTILLHVRDEEGKPIDANVQVRNHVQNYLLGIHLVGPGEYEVIVNNAEPAEYQLSAEKDGYLFYNQKVNIPGTSETGIRLEYNLVIRKLKQGSWSVLRNVYFDFDKATLKEESNLEINKLYKMLSENSRFIAEIAGHTDKIGRPEYNYKLSYKRALAVVNALIQKGIDPVRLKAVGYGATKPLASNDDEDEGRELNRRVEFRVLRYLY